MDELRADRPELQRRLLAALECLRGQPEVDAECAAAIGFCFGGLSVLDIARTGENIAGTSVYTAFSRLLATSRANFLLL